MAQLPDDDYLRRYLEIAGASAPMPSSGAGLVDPFSRRPPPGELVDPFGPPPGPGPMSEQPPAGASFSAMSIPADAIPRTVSPAPTGLPRASVVNPDSNVAASQEDPVGAMDAARRRGVREMVQDPAAAPLSSKLTKRGEGVSDRAADLENQAQRSRLLGFLGGLASQAITGRPEAARGWQEGAARTESNLLRMAESERERRAGMEQFIKNLDRQREEAEARQRQFAETMGYRTRKLEEVDKPRVEGYREVTGAQAAQAGASTDRIRGQVEMQRRDVEMRDPDSDRSRAVRAWAAQAGLDVPAGMSAQDLFDDPTYDDRLRLAMRAAGAQRANIVPAADPRQYIADRANLPREVVDAMHPDKVQQVLRDYATTMTRNEESSVRWLAKFETEAAPYENALAEAETAAGSLSPGARDRIRIATAQSATLGDAAAALSGDTEAQEYVRRMNAAANMMLRARSGLAVTEQELERARGEMGIRALQDPDGVLNFLRTERQVLAGRRARMRGAISPVALERYEGRAREEGLDLREGIPTGQAPLPGTRERGAERPERGRTRRRARLAPSRLMEVTGSVSGMSFESPEEAAEYLRAEGREVVREDDGTYTVTEL